MAQPDATELMRSAWAIRRRSFAAPAGDQETLICDARRKLIDAVEICRQAGALHELAQATHMLANVEVDIGRNEAAQALWEEAVSVCRDLGDNLQLAHKLRHLGDLHFRLGRLVQAETSYVEALTLYRGHEDPPKLDLANALTRYAKLKEINQSPQDALQLWNEARKLYDVIELPMGVEECSRNISRLSKLAEF